MSCGLYLVGAAHEGRDYGCVVNTVTQVTAEPAKLMVAINKENATTAAVLASGRFEAAVLCETAPMELIGTFGFKTSREVDKFAPFQTARDAHGVPYVTQDVAARFGCKVVDTLDAEMCIRDREYMEQYRSDKDLGALKGHLKKLVAQRDALNEEIAATFKKIMDLQERFRHSDQLRTHEFPISAHSAALGRTLEQLRFRTSTGGTVIAVRHEGRLLLSPGPDTALEAGDTLVVACSVSDMGRVAQLLN